MAEEMAVFHQHGHRPIALERRGRTQINGTRYDRWNCDECNSITLTPTRKERP